MSEDDGEESDFYCDYCGSGSHSSSEEENTVIWALTLWSLVLHAQSSAL